MKTLYLIRHAKSSWGDASLTDYKRPLNERGKKDVITMGKRLLAKNILPDTILASSAKRTQKTTKSIAKTINYTNSLNFSKELYLAPVDTLLYTVNNISDIHSSAFIVGHNPGISNFCDYLTHQFYDFPTCGIAKLTFKVDSWKEISNNLGDLEWFDYPKNIH